MMLTVRYIEIQYAANSNRNADIILVIMFQYDDNTLLIGNTSITILLHRNNYYNEIFTIQAYLPVFAFVQYTLQQQYFLQN